jgi:hypothetical protein
MDSEVLRMKAKRWGVEGRSQAPRRGRAWSMRREAQQGQEGIRKELRMKAVNRQQMILRAVEVEKLIEADHPGSSGNLCVNGGPLRERMKAPAILHGLGHVD